MTNAEIVLAVVDWIEERLSEELPVPALAKRAGYSLHHFVRLFHGVVGQPPRDYVLRRRLSEAARELARGKRGVTEVAFDYAFNGLETFTRAFRREFGTTPSAVRRGASRHHRAARPAPLPPARDMGRGRGGRDRHPDRSRGGGYLGPSHRPGG